MTDSTNSQKQDSTTSSDTSTITMEDQLSSTPHGFRKFVILSKNAPKRKKGRIQHEIKEDNSIGDLIQHIDEMHTELVEVVALGNRIAVDCSGCFANCIKIKTKVKVNDVNVSTI